MKTRNTHKKNAHCTAAVAVVAVLSALSMASASTWELDVTSDETVTGTVPEGATKIVKSGSGTYTLDSSGQVNTFNGEINVAAGTFTAQNGTWDLQGSTLIGTGSGFLQFRDVELVNPGGIGVNGVSMTLIENAKLNGTSANVLCVEAGRLLMNYMRNPLAWTVELARNCNSADVYSLSAQNGAHETLDLNVIEGPVQAMADATRVRVLDGGRLTFKGGLSLADGKTFRKAGAGVLRICGESKMNGTTWLEQGMLLYGNGASVEGYVPSSVPDTASPPVALKVEPGANLTLAGNGNGHGSWGFNGYGAVWMTGGTATIGDGSWGFRLGQTGGADLFVSGGTLTLKAQNLVLGNDATGSNPYTLSVAGGSSVLHVEGGSIFPSASGAVVNLSDGGVIRARNIRGKEETELTVNFDGGVFAPLVATPMDKAYRTSVYVHAGGAVVDTGDQAVKIATAFQKPPGCSIRSIDLPTAESDPENYAAFSDSKTFYGTPVSVRIRGSGTGASAFLEIDEKTLKPVRIVVTGKGSGYGEDTTVTLDSPDGTTRYTCPVTWTAADVAGGFTKRGAGTLTLTGANTYGGATRVEAGALAFASAEAFPGGDIEFPASALLSDAPPSLTAPSLAFRDGAKIRITGAEALQTAEPVRFRTVITVTEPLTALPEVEFVGTDGQPVVVPHPWAVRLSKDGKRISFGYRFGALLIIR